MECQTDLPQIIAALRQPGGFTGLLDRRHQERHQNGNDGDHDQKLNQSKAGNVPGAAHERIPSSSNREGCSSIMRE
jgi:hypothetical protein